MLSTVTVLEGRLALWLEEVFQGASSALYFFRFTLLNRTCYTLLHDFINSFFLLCKHAWREAIVHRLLRCRSSSSLRTCVWTANCGFAVGLGICCWASAIVTSPEEAAIVSCGCLLLSWSCSKACRLACLEAWLLPHPCVEMAQLCQYLLNLSLNLSTSGGLLRGSRLRCLP